MKLNTYIVKAGVLILTIICVTSELLKAQDLVEGGKGEFLNDLNVLEERFMAKIFYPLLSKAKATGERVPEGDPKSIGHTMIKDYREMGILTLSDADKQQIKDKRKVDSFDEDLAYWKELVKKMAASKGAVSIDMQVNIEYFTSLTAKSDIEDQLLMSKFTKALKMSEARDARTLEISKAKQVFMVALEKSSRTGKWLSYVDLNIDDAMKFRDPATGKLMDWMMHIDAKGLPKEVFIVSPKPWKGFYIITKNNGSTMAVPLKEAKEKYGVGR